MPSLLSVSPHANFWQVVARQVFNERAILHDLEVIVPTFAHAQCLKQALAAQAGSAMLAPRIHTLDAWLALKIHTGTTGTLQTQGKAQRLMALYAELRQHAWLGNLFAASQALDLLPLATTLLDLCDELSTSFLPAMLAHSALTDIDCASVADFAADFASDFATIVAPDVLWQQALEQLAPPVRALLSEEAQLVWRIWKAQVDTEDPSLVRQQNLLRLAQQARRPLLWIHPVAPNRAEQMFLAMYARQQTVRVITLDWRPDALAAVVQTTWPEMFDAPPHPPAAPLLHSAEPLSALPGFSLCPATGLEQEAQQGAQCLLNWLQEGKTRIAIVAQDRVVARRIRALMERAQVWVADETGWKLSTTRAAAAIAAWFEVLASQAEVISLLDLLKSPFVWPAMPDKDAWLMTLEASWRRQNVLAGWPAIIDAVPATCDAAPLQRLARQAALFTGRKSLAQWSELTEQTLEVLGIRSALAQDMAGRQVLIMLADIHTECRDLPHDFHFSEWRACLSLQMEATAFVPDNPDQRIVMLPLNGARLRRFEAVLMVGCDAKALPSEAPEVLFFANAVRRELGLTTREQRAQQQMRDFTEILSSGAQVILSWQQFKNGEPNACSPWIERLQLVLTRAGTAPQPVLNVTLTPHTLQTQAVPFAAPCAPALLPAQLSASGYQRLLGCPYAFFASHMLGLAAWNEFSDLPEKRDYGNWLHGILHQYHEALQTTPNADNADKAALLAHISTQRFEQELQHSAAALGYWVRWQKVMPAYLAWAAEHETQGWHYWAGEQQYQRLLEWEGGQILLRGRIDRIDQQTNGEQAVLDYKTSNQAALKKKLAGEDPQLAFYGLLAKTSQASQASQASLIALEATKQKIAAVPADNFENRVQQLEQHILHSMQALQQGAALPANGVDTVCQYCDMGGLCRKGAWQ